MRFTQDTAFHVAQRLLDWGLIADVEGELISRGHSPTFSLSYEFPDLTQIPGYNYSDRPFSRQSDDSTPQATPRATPRPNLRDSIRTASRLSLLKYSTPGLRNLDKSASYASNRSLRQSKLEKSDRFDRGEKTIGKQSCDSSRDASTDDSNIAQTGNETGNSSNNSASINELLVEIHDKGNKSVTEIPVTGKDVEATLNSQIDNGAKSRENYENVNHEQSTGELSEIVKEITDAVGAGGGNEEANDRNVGKEKYNGTLIENGNKAHNSESFESGYVQESTEIAKSKTLIRTSSLNNVRIQSETSDKREPDQEQSGLKPETPSNQETEFDPYLPSGTPVSFSSGLSCSSHSILFIGTSDHFYYVCPQVGGEMETTLKNYEQYQMVEECYQKKILPEYILRIIYSRRKNDVGARNFVQNLPYNVIQTLIQEDEDTSMCVSS